MRIGQGVDAHAFCEERPLIVGGVTIPFEKGLAGHSDADVLVHAIMDALLGAAALGDIGVHFPDRDEQYRNISSLVLLGLVNTLITDQQYYVGNIDATLIAQAPRFQPYIEAMRRNLASALGVAIDQVSVKATTTEYMGFTGRSEGILAVATALLWKPSF